MKQKILSQLVTKYQGKPKALLGLIADKLAAKVTEESEIEGVINELDNMPFSIDDYADFLQKESDRRVTEAVQKAKSEKEKGSDKSDPPKKEDPEPTKTDDKGDNAMETMLKELMNEVKSMKAEKVQGTIKSKVQSELDKEIPESLYKGRLPDNEDDIPAFIEEVNSDWAAIKKSVVGENLGSDAPWSGAPAKQVTTTTEKALDEDVASFAKKQVEQQKAQQNGT